MALPTSDNTVNVTRLGSILSTLWNKIKNKFATKADLASPTFTGTPTMPTIVGLGQAYVNSSGANSSGTYAITASNFSLSTGGVISIRFTENCPASAKLNVNSKGSKDIYFRNAAITARTITNGDIATFQYDGTRFQLLSTSCATEQIANAVQTTHLVGASGSVSSAGYVEIASIKCQPYCDSPYTFELYPRHYPVSTVEFTLEGTAAAGTVMNAKHYVTDTSVPEVGYTYTDASSVRTYHLWIKRLRDDDSLTVFCKARSANKDYVQIKNWGESSSASAPSGYVAITKVKTLTPTDVAVGTNNGQLKVNGTDITVYTHPTQTAYSAKGTATKVPQITTDSTGHVTNIEEVDIGYSNSTDLVVSNENNSTPFLLYEISNVGLTQSYTTAVTELMVYLVRSRATATEQATANHMSFKVSIHWQWSLVRTNIEGSLPFGTVTAVLVNSATPAAGSDVSTLKIYLTPENYVSYRVAVTDNRIRGNGNLVRGTITKRGVREAIPTASALVIVGTTNVMTMQTKENLITSWNSTPSDTMYPSEKLVKGSLDAKAPNAVTTEAAIATGDKLLFSDASDSSKTMRMSTGFDTSVSDTFLCRNGNFATVKEADVRWGGSFRQELSPIEFGNMCRNVIHNPPPAAIKFEKTTDGGTTWTEQTVTDNAKMQLCNLTLGSNFSIANSEYTGISSPNMLKARITLTALENFTVTSYSDTWFYAQCKRIVVYCYKSGNSQMKIETQSGPDFIAHNDTWTDRGTYAIAGDGGWNSIPFDMIVGGFSGQLSNRPVAIRFTYWIESGSAPRISISRIGIIPQIHWSTRAGNIPFLGVPIGIENNGDGTIAKASRLSTARKTYVTLGTASTTTTRDWSGDTTIPVDGTLPIANGGTGKTSVTSGNYLVGNGTGALTEKTPNAVGNNVLTSLATDDDNLIEGDYIIASNHTSGATDTTKFVRRTTARLWNYIKSQISSVLGLTVTNYGGNAATATTATKVSGTQVEQDSNARHLWFSTTVETQRGYTDSLMYRTDINRITANISGYASGLNRSNIIEHQGNKDTYPLHRIASYPDSSITTQSKYGDNSLILHLFTKGNRTTDYGIVMITVKMQSEVDSTHAPLINVSWKLRSSGISADAVQAVCIFSGGLWHVDVFFRIQHQYQLTVFNKLGSYSVDSASPKGGWDLYSSTDKSGSESEIYTTYSGDTNAAASWKLYNLSSYHSAGNKLGDDGIVGMATTATAFNIASATTGNVVDNTLYKIPVLNDNAAGCWTGKPSTSTGTQQRLLYNPNNNTINANITGDAQTVRGFYITKTIVSDTNAIIFF